MKYLDIARELLAMAEADQRMRKAWMDGGTYIAEIDEKNTARLKEIVAEIGWPTISRVGEDASYHAWLLAQHAKLEIQKEFLTLMQKEARDVHPQDLAMLNDRVRAFSGLTQIYGTQFRVTPEGQLEPYPIEDPKHLNERRKALGFRTFEEDFEQMKVQHEHHRKNSPPTT